jgi:hypothetical protein
MPLASVVEPCQTTAAVTNNPAMMLVRKMPGMLPPLCGMRRKYTTARISHPS